MERGGRSASRSSTSPLSRVVKRGVGKVERRELPSPTAFWVGKDWERGGGGSASEVRREDLDIAGVGLWEGRYHDVVGVLGECREMAVSGGKVGISSSSLDSEETIVMFVWRRELDEAL